MTDWIPAGVGGATTIIVPITVHAPGAQAGAAEDIAQAVAREVRVYFEGIERQIGLAPEPG